MRIFCLLLGVLVASCSAGFSSVGPMPPLGMSASAAAPDATLLKCPIPGKTYRSGKASTVFASKLTFFGFPQLLSWTVTFKDQSSMRAPVRYAPQITTCGPARGKKPFGKIKNMEQTSLKSSCDNGVCTVTATYSVQYKPKAEKNRFHKAWQYDLIRFAPSPANNAYGVLPAFRIEVGPPPA